MKGKIYYIAILLMFALVAFSCEQNLEVKRNYGFDVKTEKYHETIEEGETRTIKIHLVSDGEYEGAEYYVSYFVRQGTGIVADEGWNVLEENSFYKISPDTFILRYTANSVETHKIELVFKDSFGNEKETVINLSGR